VCCPRGVVRGSVSPAARRGAGDACTWDLLPVMARWSGEPFSEDRSNTVWSTSMTGQKATPRQTVWRTVKAVAFLAVVLGACVLFSPSTGYVTGVWTAAIAATAFPIMYSTPAPRWRYS